MNNQQINNLLLEGGNAPQPIINPEINNPIIPYKNALFNATDLPKALHLFQNNKAFGNSIREIANTIIKGESSLSNLNAVLQKYKQHDTDNTFPTFISDRFKKEPESTRLQFMKTTLHDAIKSQQDKVNIANEYVKSIDTQSILASKLLKTIEPRRPGTTKDLILKAMDVSYEPVIGKKSNISMTKFIQEKISSDMMDIAYVFQENQERQEEIKKRLAIKKEKAKEIKTLNLGTPIQVTENSLNKTVFRIIKEVNEKTASSRQVSKNKSRRMLKEPDPKANKTSLKPKGILRKKPVAKGKSRAHFGKSV